MTTETAQQKKIVARDLPYAYDALAPHVSEETLRYHHDKHYEGYVAKLNELLADSALAGRPLAEIVVASDGPLFNNAAQAWNHEFFFESLSPAPQTAPSGRLREAIDRDFGSFDQFKTAMSKAAASLFGSGWVWLVEEDSGRLSIISESNAGNPMRYHMKPLLCIDVWEHAYYIDYRNRRADAVKAIWPLIDWKTVEQRYRVENK